MRLKLREVLSDRCQVGLHSRNLLSVAGHLPLECSGDGRFGPAQTRALCVQARRARCNLFGEAQRATAARLLHLHHPFGCGNRRAHLHEFLLRAAHGLLMAFKRSLGAGAHLIGLRRRFAE